MFESIGFNAVVTNACVLSSGVLLGFVIKTWLKSESKTKSEHSKNAYEEEVLS